MTKHSHGFPIAIVGASGKSPESLIALLSALHPNSRTAYVIFIDNDTHFAIDAMRSECPIAITEVISIFEPEPGKIYLIPAQNALVLNDGTLQLTRLTRSDVNLMPLDASMAAMAEKYGPFAVGVLLSGLGGDGVMGLRKIQEEGGVTLSQTLETAHYRMRLNEAMTCNAVDFAISPDLIPQKIEYAHQASIECHAYFDDEVLPSVEDGILAQILWMIFIRTGTDFRTHNQTFVRRRVAYRMANADIVKPAEYLALLKKDKSEQERLFDALLPTFSHFFQYPDMLNRLMQTVLPDFDTLTAGKPLRIWVVNCGTGQSAYTIAMAVHQSLDLQNRKVQIFASDLSTKAIETARAGVYLPHEAQEVPRALRDLYFDKKGRNHHVVNEIRRMCVFSSHDVIKDPPFSKLNLIFCGNAAGNYTAETGEKLFSQLHYALNAGGMLFCAAGSGSLAKLFEPTHVPDFYRSKPIMRKSPLKAKAVERLARMPGSMNVKKPTNPSELFLAHAPVGVIVDKNGDISHFHGDTSPYLHPATGKPNFNIHRMIRPLLEFGISKAFDEAVKMQTPATEIVIDPDTQKQISIEVIPVGDQYQMLFTSTSVHNLKYGGSSLEIRQLEQEMHRWRQDFLSAMEERETAFEELQTTHEELVSSSEEVQLINEELENALENLRSANEELSSLNEELYTRQHQTAEQRNFSDAIIATIHEPLVVVDREFIVHRVNPAFCSYLDTPECDIVGEMLFDVINFNSAELKPLLINVFKDGKTIDSKNVQAHFPTGERAMLLNASRIPHTKPPLILIAFKDISEKMAAFKLLEAKNRELELYNLELQAFGSAANHDLQEPLRKTIVFAKRILSEDRALSESSRYFLERTVVSMEHMQKLVKDSIKYMQSGKIAPKLKPTDLSSVVKKSIIELEKIINAKHVKIEMGQLPEVRVLPDQVKQLFTSLMMNAICYSKSDVEPQVNIVADSVRQDEIDAFTDVKSAYYKISITDNGQGFDESQADRIFDPFFRLHSKDNIPGSGLGLTLCKKIMSNHNGFIKASGRLNHGCTIDLYFPAS